MMTIDELQRKVSDGEKITYGQAKDLLAGHEILVDGIYNFDNCTLTSNTLDDDSILYTPI